MSLDYEPHGWRDFWPFGVAGLTVLAAIAAVAIGASAVLL